MCVYVCVSFVHSTQYPTPTLTLVSCSNTYLLCTSTESTHPYTRQLHTLMYSILFYCIRWWVQGLSSGLFSIMWCLSIRRGANNDKSGKRLSVEARKKEGGKGAKDGKKKKKMKVTSTSSAVNLLSAPLAMSTASQASRGPPLERNVAAAILDSCNTWIYCLKKEEATTAVLGSFRTPFDGHYW